MKSVQNFVCKIIIIKISFYKKRIWAQINSINFGIVYFCQMQLAGQLKKKYLVLGLTTDWHVLKSAYLYKSCLEYPHIKRAAFQHFVIHRFDYVLFNEAAVC